MKRDHLEAFFGEFSGEFAGEFSGDAAGDSGVTAIGEIPG
jgi:hypothetical protein